MDERKDSEASTCSYFISSKGNYAVIAFSGVLDNKSEDIFIDAGKEIDSLDGPCFFILCLAGVELFSPSSLRNISKLQSDIREKGYLLRVCGLNTANQMEFLNSGTIRRTEIKRNIADAVKGFIKLKQNKEKKRQ